MLKLISAAKRIFRKRIKGNARSEMHALDLLTEDCWKEILMRVKEPEDLWSCSQACVTFQEILRRKRNMFMFDLILPHILKYLPAPGIPHDNELQQWKAALKTRLVCKCWATSIDKLRDEEHHFVFRTAYQFTSGEGIEQFLQTFATHSGNPFLGRIISFELRPTPPLLAGNPGLNADRDPAEGNMAFFNRKRRQILERFGNQILTVIIHNDGDKLTFCKNIQMDLSLLPNLHGLHLRSPYRTNLELDIEEIVELTTNIAANPLPDLPRLRDLRAWGVNREMMQFILQKYAPQLKYLFVGDLSGFPFPEHSSRLSNLVELFLGGLDASTPLEALRQLQSPLRELGFEVARNITNVRVWPIDELFRNIDHLPIRRLTIWIANTFLGESGAISTDHRPHHGSISSVQLRFQSRGASFNFLLYCPELTSVHIVDASRRPGVLVEGHPDGVPELLDVGELLGQVGHDLYQSNVWDNLHRLQDFKFEKSSNRRCHLYNRGEYEKRHLEKGEVAAGEES